MKIGAVGANIPWVTAAGATPVTIKGLATMYNALKTGIYEGGVLWQQAMAGFKFCEITKYKLAAGFGAVANALLTANTDSWPKIPREVQAAIVGSDRHMVGGRQPEDHRRRQVGSRGLREEIRPGNPRPVGGGEEDLGLRDPQYRAGMGQASGQGGAPGTKMLGDYMDYMRDKKQLVTRNWDKE